MQTFERICTKNVDIKDDAGNCLELKKGKKYIVSAEKDGEVTVFSKYWVDVPAKLFSKGKEFTK